MLLLKRLMLVMVLYLTTGWMSAAAYTPLVESLGNQTLVLEDETTVLSLFNLGNPAALSLLPVQDRLDLTLAYRQTMRSLAYITGPLGDPTTIDPAGNTLPPETLFSFSNTTRTLFYNPWTRTGYGGVITHLDPALTLQIIPFGRTAFNEGSTVFPDASAQSGGGLLRAAYRLNAALSVGGGFGYAAGEGIAQLDLASLDAAGASLAPWVTRRQDQQALSGELGVVWQQLDLFDPEDRLDLGILAHLSYGLDEREETLALFADRHTFTLERSPWDLKVHGVYSYLDVMDIGLEVDYLNQRDYLTEDNRLIIPGDDVLSTRFSQWQYDLSFRVRLPMVRQDDLRFGVVFSNRGNGHPYPSGRLEWFDPSSLSLGPVIETASSSIGIGTAVVPLENWIIALEYRLSSSKSRQSRLIIADSGTTDFALGAQFQIVKWLFLRAGFSNQRLSFEAPVQGVTDTTTLRFGLGFETGPWRIDLTGLGSKIIHNPRGYDFSVKPPALESLDTDDSMAYSILTGVSWIF